MITYKIMDYNVYRMSKLDDSVLPTNIDVFIFFDADEERSWNVLENSIIKFFYPKDLIILKHTNMEAEKDIDKYLNNNVNYKKIYIDKDYSSNIISCLKEISVLISDKEVIGIDISSMPIPIFAQILHLIMKRYNKKKIVIYYTEPIHYNIDNYFE